jgi:hypothetical protein
MSNQYDDDPELTHEQLVQRILTVQRARKLVEPDDPPAWFKRRDSEPAPAQQQLDTRPDWTPIIEAAVDARVGRILRGVNKFADAIDGALARIEKAMAKQREDLKTMGTVHGVHRRLMDAEIRQLWTSLDPKARRLRQPPLDAPFSVENEQRSTEPIDLPNPLGVIRKVRDLQ